jgi:hypothetical protein
VQDNDGNTPLHVAAMVGNQWSFYLLIHNPQVQLDLVNNKGQTPLDIAWMMIPQGLNFALVIHQSHSSIVVFESIVFLSRY